MRFSTNQVLACGTTPADVDRRLACVGVLPRRQVLEYAAIGDPVTVADHVRQFADAGADVMYFHCWDPSDLDMLRLVADQVVPRLR
jgi:alkanesulfonate monooxygenase SsuD/methylene tetrahydromethanopterin reductase-like flavin-dependent oxidoreductase (luciferase family)